MRQYSIATPWHMRQYSFEDLKKYLSSHEDLFDNIFEKTIEAGIIIIVAVFIYMVVLIIVSLNIAQQAYADGISYLLGNALQDLIYNSLQDIMRNAS